MIGEMQMLVYKLLGGGSIVISAILFYFESQSYNKKFLKQLSAYISLIEFIKNQVGSYLMPIDEIIKHCDDNIIKECIMNDKTDMSHIDNLNDIINLACYYIDKETLDIIYRFANDFGLKYRSEQLVSCELYIDELREIFNKKKENYEKEKRVRFVLCICLSFSMVLLLI